MAVETLLVFRGAGDVPSGGEQWVENGSVDKMGIPHEMRPDMSVTDLAYYILRNRGQALHFKELISEIMRVKAINQENPGRLIAQMHTEINLDSRFLHHGGGEWGLREWQPKNAKVVRIRPDAPATGRGRQDLRSDEEEDFDVEPEEEELMEDEEQEELDTDQEDMYEEEED